MEFVKIAGPAGVFFIMFALGLNLTVESFVKVLKKPNNFFVGIICQTLLLPIIGIIVISLIQLDPEYQFGIFLLLIMPSAAMSNYATRLVDGNVALSITLTSTCALFSFITIPLYLGFFEKYIYKYDFDLNLFLFSIKAFLFITVPVLLGMFCMSKFTSTFEKITVRLDKLALFLFLIIVSIAIYLEKDNLHEYFDDIGIVAAFLVCVILLVSYLITKIFVEDNESKKAIVIEALLQNGAMGFVVGSLIFTEVVYLIPIAIYALMQYFVLLFYIANSKIKN